MIEVENLVKEFGTRRAVDDVSFTVEKGTVLGFLGPNGAGKTTTMRMIAGFLAPTAGTARVMGLPIQPRPELAQKHIGYMPENSPLYGEMTVETLLRFVAELRGLRGGARNKRVDEVIEMCFLQAARHQMIDTLSKGYRQRTCMAQAFLHDPPVLLLDEPTEGLDPNQKKVVRDMIKRMGAEKAIMLSTHVLEEVEALCSRVIIISEGKLVIDSSPADLKRRSPSYNQLTLRVAADAEEARAAFAAIPDVERVDLLRAENGSTELRLYPRDQQPLATSTLELSRSRGWQVLDMQTESGRLDEVFRNVTITDDAA